MKFILASIVLFIVLGSCKDSSLEAEVGQKTTMRITKVFNAGERVKGEKIHASFEVENTGRYPLVFGSIKGSCSCTVGEKPEAPILPGKKGVIKAVCTPSNINFPFKYCYSWPR